MWWTICILGMVWVTWWWLSVLFLKWPFRYLRFTAPNQSSPNRCEYKNYLKPPPRLSFPRNMFQLPCAFLFAGCNRNQLLSLENFDNPNVKNPTLRSSEMKKLYQHRPQITWKRYQPFISVQFVIKTIQIYTKIMFCAFWDPISWETLPPYLSSPPGARKSVKLNRLMGIMWRRTSDEPLVFLKAALLKPLFDSGQITLGSYTGCPAMIAGEASKLNTFPLKKKTHTPCIV